MKSLRSLVSVAVLGVAGVLAGCSDSTREDVSSSEDGAQAVEGESAQSAQALSEAKVERGPRGREFGGHRGGPSLVAAALRADLGLSAEQKSSLQALLAASRPARGERPEPSAEQKAQFEAKRTEFRAKQGELAAAIRSGDVEALRAAQPARGERPEPSAEQKAQFEAKRAEHKAQQVKELQTLHATLTAEQRAKLVESLHAGRGGEGDAREEGPRGPRGKGFGGHGAGPMHGPDLRELASELKLTEAQQAKLKAGFEAARPQRLAPSAEQKAAFEAKRAERKAQLQAFASEAFDAQAFVAGQAHERPAFAEEAKAKAPQNPMIELVQVLTAEQREQLAQRIERGPSFDGARHGGKRGAHAPRGE